MVCTNVPGIVMVLLIYGAGLAAILYVLGLLTRFVRAFERMATSLEEVARTLKDDRR
jgi:cytochrome c biogenesis protein CcdA